MLELIKTGGLLAVAVVSAAATYNILDQSYYDLEEIIGATFTAGLAVVTGLPAIGRIRRYFRE